MQKGGVIYIMASPNRTTWYTGVTSDLLKRVWEHRSRQLPHSFTAQYNCVELVYYRSFDRIEEAIAEEKRIKAGNRRAKEKLINIFNSSWTDLWGALSGEC